MKPDGGPAFPHFWQYRADGDPVRNQGYEPGMSLRDWFAGMALQGYLAAWPKDGENMILTMPKAAKDIYGFADAMLAERCKDQR